VRSSSCLVAWVEVLRNPPFRFGGLQTASTHPTTACREMTGVFLLSLLSCVMPRWMDPAPYLDRVLDDEGITAGLDEPEATMMIRVLGEHVRRIAAASNDPATASREVERLCRTARRIAGDLTRLPASKDRGAQLERKLAEITR